MGRMEYPPISERFEDVILEEGATPREPESSREVPVPPFISDLYPLDPDELVRYAERYGHPEEWIKKAQELHAKVERLEAELAQAHSFAIENFGAEG
jgi:hypothetical protein